MRIVKKIIGYSLAFLAIPLVLATFIGMDFWGSRLAATTGVQVSPWYTGNDVSHTVNHGSYELRVHRPVFDGLLRESREGFVQIDWAPLESVPATVDEEIDWNADGVSDFSVSMDTRNKTAKLTPHTPDVTGLEGPFKLKAGYSVRVGLLNPGR